MSGIGRKCALRYRGSTELSRKGAYCLYPKNTAQALVNSEKVMSSHTVIFLHEDVDVCSNFYVGYLN